MFTPAAAPVRSLRGGLMPRTCSVCADPQAREINEALRNEGAAAAVRRFNIPRSTVYRHLSHIQPQSESERRQRILAARSDDEIVTQLMESGRMSEQEAEKVLHRLRPESAPRRAGMDESERAQIEALDRSNMRAAEAHRVQRLTGGAPDRRRNAAGRFLRSWEQPETQAVSPRARDLAAFADEQRALRRRA